MLRVLVSTGVGILNLLEVVLIATVGSGVPDMLNISAVVVFAMDINALRITSNIIRYYVLNKAISIVNTG